jgi:hypothetical protein
LGRFTAHFHLFFMLRSLCLPLLGLALLAQTAAAQTKPAQKPTYSRNAAPRPAGMTKAPATRRTSKPAGTTAGNASGMVQSGYAAPGEPVQDPRYNGKNTPPYDGPAAPAKRNTTLSTPK